MSKYAFVILHYQTVDDTTECVKSIQNYCKNEDYEIIIVDNASPNNSGNEIKEKYSKKSKITVILNKENLGFARGNNVGFTYAKNELKADYIILLNNDTLIMQVDFCYKIYYIYKNKNVALIGPMILTADGKYTSNPISMNSISKKEVENKIKEIEKLELIYKYRLKWLRKIKNKITGYKNEKQAINYYKEKNNARLHGACLIFTKAYIEKFDRIRR